MEEIGEGTMPEEDDRGVIDGCVYAQVLDRPGYKADVICELPIGTEVMIDENESTDLFYKIYTATSLEGYCERIYISTNN